jgi:hypothetical protein
MFLLDFKVVFVLDFGLRLMLSGTSMLCLKENKATFTSCPNAVTSLEAGKVRFVGSRSLEQKSVSLMQVYLYAVPVALFQEE